MIPDFCCIAPNARAGLRSFAENRGEPSASAVGKTVSYCLARLSDEKELQDAISSSRNEDGHEHNNRSGKWNVVMTTPRQTIRPISDKPPGFQGISDLIDWFLILVSKMLPCGDSIPIRKVF
jgi:hypothetical protein